MNCFRDKYLNQKIIAQIDSSLDVGFCTADVKKLRENLNLSFTGLEKAGSFDIIGELAREWLLLPNASNVSNADVLKPLMNGDELVKRRYSDRWIIDFNNMPKEVAMQYEKPFAYVKEHVCPIRKNNNDKRRRENWWIHGANRPGMRNSLKGLQRYIVTPKVSKFRIFCWLDMNMIPDGTLAVIAKDDDLTFGILHSYIHELWALKLGNRIGTGNDPRYNNSLTFETFPFPEGLTPNLSSNSYKNDSRAIKIAKAAQGLDEWRQNWLYPKEWGQFQSEILPQYSDRFIPFNEEKERLLKKRTLTNLYNEMPDILRHLHKKLDVAVAEAYGWPADLSDEEILQRLFELNQARKNEAIT